MTVDLEQLGGFTSLNFFSLPETANWPIVLNDGTAIYVTHTPPTLNYSDFILDESIEILDNPKESSSGLIYPIDINFRILLRNDTLSEYLDTYQNIPLVVIAQLKNGTKKIYGSNLEPLFLVWKNIEGKKVDDLPLLAVSIKGETRTRPVFYNV